ncbi:MAG: response regulator transcription factor [Actinobacteria bacterium]|jgi:DNA-binding NarL/FixJ family response regulator|nr:response regulator transcription factor [Actinomycetota bacterium]
MVASAPAVLESEASSKSTATVVIVDDHMLMREGTKEILEHQGGGAFVVVGEAGTAEEAWELIRHLDPDLVLVDIRMPGGNGLELADRVVGSSLHSKVVVLSAYDDPEYVREALRAKVSGYLLKNIPGRELVRHLQAIISGATVLAPGLDLSSLSEDKPVRIADLLTSREVEVAKLAVSGRSNKEIAHHLRISRKTVEGHLHHIFDKLGVTSRIELIHYMMETGEYKMEESGRHIPKEQV